MIYKQLIEDTFGVLVNSFPVPYLCLRWRDSRKESGVTSKKMWNVSWLAVAFT